MHYSALHDARRIFLAASPVIRIIGFADKRWRRANKGVTAVGPFLKAEYKILDETAWEATKPYLYMVAGEDEVIQYAGISRNRLQDRWHLFNGYDAATGVPLEGKQLLHHECWIHFERAYLVYPTRKYEVRCIDGRTLSQLLRQIGVPLSGIGEFGHSDESVVSGVERWMSRSIELLPWNRGVTT